MANAAYYFEMARKVRPIQAAPKVWNYLKYKLLPRETETQVRRYSPQIAQLLLTTRCNLTCDYCAAGVEMANGLSQWRKREATLESVQKIFANPLFANALLVDLLGGEPLLVKDLVSIVAFLSARGHMTNMATNGIKLRERVADLKQAGISRINVSLYDTNRKVLERDLAEINKIFRTHMSYVLLRSEVEHNPNKILDAARFSHDTGSASLRMFIYRPMGLAKSPDEIISEDNAAFADLRQRINTEFPGFVKWPDMIALGENSGNKRRCAQLWQRVGASPLGDVSVCCGVDEFLQGENSNLFDTPPTCCSTTQPCSTCA